MLAGQIGTAYRILQSWNTAQTFRISQGRMYKTCIVQVRSVGPRRGSNVVN